MDPVGADDEVIRAGRTIRERHGDLVIVLAQSGHGRAEPHRDVGGALEEHAMKLTTGDANAGTGPAPHLRQFDLQQPSSGVIQDSLVRHADGSSQQRLCQPKLLQRANAVSGDVQTGATRGPRCGAFNDVRDDLPLKQRPAQSKARDATADNQYS